MLLVWLTMLARRPVQAERSLGMTFFRERLPSSARRLWRSSRRLTLGSVLVVMVVCVVYQIPDEILLNSRTLSLDLPTVYYSLALPCAACWSSSGSFRPRIGTGRACGGRAMTLVTLLVFGLFLALVIWESASPLPWGNGCLIILLYQQGRWHLLNFLLQHRQVSAARYPFLSWPGSSWSVRGFRQAGQPGESPRGPIPADWPSWGCGLRILRWHLRLRPATRRPSRCPDPGHDRQGYDRNFAAPHRHAGSTAILIPPSIAFVVYGVITRSRSGALRRGIFPVCAGAASLCRPISSPEARLGRRAMGTLRSYGWLSGGPSGAHAPAVILGSMYGGICTPTEAAIIAVVYAPARVDVSNHRLEQLYQCMLDSAVTSAVVMSSWPLRLFGWAADRVEPSTTCSEHADLSNNGMVMISSSTSFSSLPECS